MGVVQKSMPVAEIYFLSIEEVLRTHGEAAFKIKNIFKKAS